MSKHTLAYLRKYANSSQLRADQITTINSFADSKNLYKSKKPQNQIEFDTSLLQNFMQVLDGSVYHLWQEMISNIRFFNIPNKVIEYTR